MNILYVENQDDEATLVTDKLGSRNCSITRVRGVIEALGVYAMKHFDLVLVSNLSSVSPIDKLINRLIVEDTPYAFLVQARDRANNIPTRENRFPTVTVDDLGNGTLDRLVQHASA